MSSRLLVSQRDQVFEVLVRLGLDPSEFEWVMWRDREYGPDSDRLEHIDSGFYFLFQWFHQQEQFGGRCSPGSDGPNKTIYPAPWPTVFKAVTAWLRDVSREISSPNYWESARDGFRSLAQPGALDDEAFHPEEVEAISLRLSAIEERLLAAPELSPEDRRTIQEGFGDLKGAFKTLGRRQWLTFAMGWIVKIGMMLALTQPEFQHLVDEFSQALVRLISGGQ